MFRNRVHKTLDHDGLRLGGILSDIFGVNGRRILDGLVAGHPPDRILAGLTNHVHAKLEPLAQALAAALDPLALIKLKMQIEALDRADAAMRLGRARAADDADQVGAVGDPRVASVVLDVLGDNPRAVVNAYPAAADHHPHPLADQPPRHRVGVGVDHHRAVGMDRPGRVPQLACRHWSRRSAHGCTWLDLPFSYSATTQSSLTA